MLDTEKGTLNFQEYFVRERHRSRCMRCDSKAPNRRGLRRRSGSDRKAEVIVFAPAIPIGPICGARTLEAFAMLSLRYGGKSGRRRYSGLVPQA